MKKLLLFVSAITIVVAETSVFENSSIESKKKYGLSETEQYIYDNKKHLETIKQKLNSLAGNVEEQSDSQGGVQSIVITNSKKISQNTKEITLQRTTLENLTDYIEKLETTLNEMNKKIVHLQEDNLLLRRELNTTITKKLEEKASVNEVKKISKNLLKAINSNKRDLKKLKKLLEIKEPKKVFKGQDPERMLQEVKDLMAKRKYDSARIRLSYLANHTDFSRARVLYFLGEVEYQTANYKKAAKAFKASGSINTKANYMPTLLYHAGVSFQKIKDKESAKVFLQTLIDNYPKSYFIKGAKKRLRDLK